MKASVIIYFLLMLALIYLLFYSKMIIYMLVGLEALNLYLLVTLLFYMNLISIFFVLLIQVSESVMVMLLLLENITSWQSFKYWSLFY